MKPVIVHDYLKSIWRGRKPIIQQELIRENAMKFDKDGFKKKIESFIAVKYKEFLENKKH